MTELSTHSTGPETDKPRAQRSEAPDVCSSVEKPLAKRSGAPLRCAVGLGVFLSVLVTGCAEPSDRIEVHTSGEGRVEVTHVPKEAVASPAASVAASPVGPPSQPPIVVATPAPTDVAVPATSPSAVAPTDEAAKQRRIDDLQKKVQEMNSEIERLKSQPTTVPQPTTAP